MTTQEMTAQELIATLGLTAHPEGGHYRQTWVAETETTTETKGRATATCIYFVLQSHEVSHWHKVDAAELWLWHAGAPLVLQRAETEAGPAHDAVLGPDIAAGQMPQLIVEKDHWQSARTTGDWTLVSCVVSPGFQFEGFELAAPEFDIPKTT